MQIVPKFLQRPVPPPPPVPQPPKPELNVPPKPDHTVDFDDLLRAMGCDF